MQINLKKLVFAITGIAIAGVASSAKAVDLNEALKKLNQAVIYYPKLWMNMEHPLMRTVNLVNVFRSW